MSGLLLKKMSLYEGAASAGVVTLTAIAGFTESGAGTRSLALIFRADGTVDLDRTSTGPIQIASSTDWIIPNGDADSTYEIRCASVITGTWTTQAAAVGTWIDLGSDRTWRLTDTNASPFVFPLLNGAVFEIRKDGGSTLESTQYPSSGSLVANRTS